MTDAPADPDLPARTPTSAASTGPVRVAGDRRPSPAPAAPAPDAAPPHGPAPSQRPPGVLPGVLLVVALAATCVAVARTVPALSPLLLALVVGAVARNTGLLPAAARPGTVWSARHLLRAGVVLLGLQLSVPAVLALRPGELVVIASTVTVTFLVTRWAGPRLGASRMTSLLVATGFSICGAAAVAAMSAAVTTEDPTEDDVATSVAMVTVFGTVALVVMPLVHGALGLDDRQTGVWIGASVHEVAQVVAAGSAVSAAALAVAVVVKLARIVLLAPLVAVVGAVERRRASRFVTVPTGGPGPQAGRPPVVPLFVAGFLAMVVVRSLGVLPDAGLDAVKVVTTGLLTAAMIGLGADVHVPTLRRTGGPALALGAVSTAVTSGVSLAGIYLLT